MPDSATGGPFRYVDRYQLPAAGGAVTGFADEVDVLVKDLGGAV